jgi:hypothetical protein
MIGVRFAFVGRCGLNQPVHFPEADRAAGESGAVMGVLAGVGFDDFCGRREHRSIRQARPQLPRRPLPRHRRLLLDQLRSEPIRALEALRVPSGAPRSASAFARTQPKSRHSAYGHILPGRLCARSRRSRCLMLRLKRDVRSGSGLRLLEALLELPQGGGV